MVKLAINTIGFNCENPPKTYGKNYMEILNGTFYNFCNNKVQLEMGKSS